MLTIQFTIHSPQYHTAYVRYTATSRKYDLIVQTFQFYNTYTIVTYSVRTVYGYLSWVIWWCKLSNIRLPVVNMIWLCQLSNFAIHTLEYHTAYIRYTATRREWFDGANSPILQYIHYSPIQRTYVTRLPAVNMIWWCKLSDSPYIHYSTIQRAYVIRLPALNMFWFRKLSNFTIRTL